MNLYLGVAHVVIAGVVILAAVVIGAIGEWLWLAIRRRRP